MTRFFSGPFDAVVKKGRYFFVGTFITLGITGAVIASQIGPLVHPEQILPDDDPSVKLMDAVTSNFDMERQI